MVISHQNKIFRILATLLVVNSFVAEQVLPKPNLFFTLIALVTLNLQKSPDLAAPAQPARGLVVCGFPAPRKVSTKMIL